MMSVRIPPKGMALIATAAVLMAIASPTAAAPGDLDPTFDGDGKVTTDFIFNDAGRGVAIQADGKIVAAGVAICDPCAGPTTIHDFALARYNRDGSLDATFGEGDGKVTTDFFAGADEAFAVAIQADGKIVAGGAAAVSGVDFALARYNPDGSLDPTFDGDGKVTTDYGFGSSQIYGLAIQTDGRIVAAGYGASTAQDFFLARYNSNGSLDPSFDGDGKVTFLGFGPNHNQANAVAIQADGKIVAAGFASASFNETFALGRYNTDGSLDPTFDADGKVTTQLSNGDQARGVAIQRDGKIVTAGSACAFCFGAG